VHPVQQVHAGLPARGDPSQGLPAGAARRGARDLQVGRLQGQRLRRLEVHHPDRPGGLHRMHPVRQGLPGP
jgi:hypothetical protein